MRMACDTIVTVNVTLYGPLAAPCGVLGLAYIERSRKRLRLQMV